jgi:protein TonB
MKYQKRLHWDRYRPEFLKIGFIIALSIAFMAFNYTTMPPEIVPFEVVPLDVDEILIPPITTFPKEVQPPPPPEKISVVDIEPITDPIFNFEEKVEVVENVEPTADVFAIEAQPEKAPIVKLIVKEEPESDVPLIRAERMPIYGDCDENEEEVERNNCTSIKLIKHAYENVRYPALARENKIEGTVVVSFVVNKLGNVEDIKIVRDIGMGCGDEVLRAIHKLGKFKPGKQNGRPVSVVYRLPVKFSLE